MKNPEMTACNLCGAIGVLADRRTCSACRRERRARWKRRVLNEPSLPPCATPGCGQPRYWTLSQVYSYCTTHYRERRRETKRRARAKWRSTRPVQPGVVYYLRFGDRVKIGWTSNLPQRLKAVPHDELLATEPGDRTVERSRQEAFAPLQVTGEWFYYGEPLRVHVAAITARAA